MQVREASQCGDARIATHVFRRLGFRVAEPVHLSKEHWPRRFCHGACSECSLEQYCQEKQEALEMAVDRWQEAREG